MGEMVTESERHTRDERLRWHCRRALLELDIVFSRYWSAQGDQPLPDAEAQALETLLELEDHPLWHLISQPVDPQGTPESCNDLLQRLRRI